LRGSSRLSLLALRFPASRILRHSAHDGFPRRQGSSPVVAIRLGAVQPRRADGRRTKSVCGRQHSRHHHSGDYRRCKIVRTWLGWVLNGRLRHDEAKRRSYARLIGLGRHTIWKVERGDHNCLPDEVIDRYREQFDGAR